MAAIVLRLRHHHRHCHRLVRLYSSDNPSDSDPDHAGKLYADIKARLRQSPPRRPTAIPPPPPSSRPPPPSRPAKAASLDEIRKHLSEFRSRTAPPNPPSPPPSFSFSEIYKSSVPGQPGDRQEPPFSFDVIRESLRNIRKPADAGDAVKPARPPSPTLSPESLQALKDGLKLQQPNAADSIKDSTFQTKPVDSSYRMDYLKIYSHKELGEKLRQLRPQVGKDKTDWFSLAELNERLKKVKAMDEEKYEKRPVGVTFQDLRQCLMMMKEETDNKKNQVNLMQRHSILNSILGDDTPDYMSLPPREHLVEKYFHPDNMSSAEKLKLELKQVRDEFKISETDCGSTRVQIAQLTTKIKHLSTVLHKKDKHSRKGLQDMVQRRKKLLKYLRRTDWDSYSFVLSKLGLRDNPDYKN